MSYDTGVSILIHYSVRKEGAAYLRSTSPCCDEEVDEAAARTGREKKVLPERFCGGRLGRLCCVKETLAAWESGAETRKPRRGAESLIVWCAEARREPKERLEENVGSQDGRGRRTARVCEDCVSGRTEGGGYMSGETRARPVDGSESEQMIFSRSPLLFISSRTPALLSIAVWQLAPTPQSRSHWQGPPAASS